MEVEIISREVIKPSKPTPPHCKTYNISILDQWLPGCYIPVLLWYQSLETAHENSYINDELPMRLKNSLSDVLAHYYPLAGRVKDTVSIDCNDDGVLFLEAHVKNELKLADILPKPWEIIETPLLNIFFPDDLQWKDPGKDDTLLAVQLTRFDCGGFSIGICMSHKIADACTVSNFVNDWSTLARQSADSTTTGPLLNGDSLFPPDDQFPFNPTIELSNFVAQAHNFVTRRFVFPGTKISELKAIIAAHGSCNPTRVEVVNAILFRSIVKGQKKLSPCIFTLGINMRSRMTTKLPANSMGNFLYNFTVTINKDDYNKDENLGILVAKLKDELKRSCDFARNTNAKEWITRSMELLYQPLIHDPTSYIAAVGSWCRFPFYQIDFGLGKPLWVSTTGDPSKNNIILIDNVDGHGIEAWVTSDAELMTTLQGDQDLLKFTI